MLSDIIYNFLNEASSELKKEKNMNLLKKNIINPVIKEVIQELYPYFIRFIASALIMLVILLVTIILNIKVIFSS